MKKLLTTALGLCLLAGCSTSTSQKVGLGLETYTVTTNSMTTLSRNDKINMETAEEFESFRAPVKQYLDIAVEDLLDGDNDTTTAENALDILIPILDQMLAAEQEARSGK